MSRLDALINEYCPNGVQRYRVDELCTISRGRVMSKEYIKENTGEYPVYSSQTENNGELGCISAYDFDGEYLTWTTDGANAGTVFYRTGKFSITNVCGLLKAKVAFINIKYLFYTLNVEAPKYVNSGMGNPKLMSNVMAGIKILIPPLPVQEEIVRILDSFTQLTAELQAELQARKKQYEYYKNSLLDFSCRQDVPVYRLGDVCTVQAGGTPSRSNPEYWNNGTVKWLSSTVCKNAKSIDVIPDYITELGLAKSPAKLMKPGTTLIALVGATIGKLAFLDFEAAINQNIAGVYPNDLSIIIPEYVYYICTTLYEKFLNLGNGKLTMANMSFVRGLEIPVPTIKEQKHIVSVLERFEKLCTDIEYGIPAEIEARQKQYEYYRDKLLSFKELA